MNWAQSSLRAGPSGGGPWAGELFQSLYRHTCDMRLTPAWWDCLEYQVGKCVSFWAQNRVLVFLLLGALCF